MSDSFFKILAFCGFRAVRNHFSDDEQANPDEILYLLTYPISRGDRGPSMLGRVERLICKARLCMR